MDDPSSPGPGRLQVGRDGQLRGLQTDEVVQHGHDAEKLQEVLIRWPKMMVRWHFVDRQVVEMNLERLNFFRQQILLSPQPFSYFLITILVEDKCSRPSRFLTCQVSSREVKTT